MAFYWMTFRIADKTINGRKYEQRYQDVVETVSINASKMWTEPTSFIAFESANSIQSLGQALVSAIAPTDDMFLIREVDKQSALLGGWNNDDKIFDMISYLKYA